MLIKTLVIKVSVFSERVGRVDKVQVPPECRAPEFQAKKMKNNF